LKKLVFKLDYAGKLLSGEKVTTIRLSTNLNPGEVVEVYAGHVRIGRAKIISVRRKKIRELTDEDAQADGYISREELLRDLSKIYGRSRLRDESEVYIIEFQML